MLSYSDFFEQELKKLVEAEIYRLLQVLSHGTTINDMSDYRHVTGQLSALRNVFELCDEARSITNRH